MRLLEALILFALFLSACTVFLRTDQRPRWGHRIPLVTLALILAHLGIEGYRWQMVPAYGLAVILLSASSTALRERTPSTRPDRKVLRLGSAIGALLVIGLTVIGATVLPVFDLSKPSGAYAVGTAELMFEDEDRLEAITEDPDDHRKLVVRAWYPADGQDTSRRKTYMPPEEAAAFAQKYGLPPFMTSHLRHVETHAFEEVPVAADEPAYPVLLFSHGYNVPPSTYTSLLTEIASQGFIVFAINHTYESTASVFPDGRVAAFHHEFADREHEGVWEQIRELEGQYWQAEGASNRLRVVRDITDVYPMSDTQRRWANDLSFVVDELERRRADDTQPSYFARLDLSRLGAFGHSAGGGAAGQALVVDDRIRAGANWDGAQWGDVIDSTLTRPFLRVETARDSATFAPNDLIYRATSQDVVYTVTIDGAGHGSFSDIPLVISVPQINGSGSIDARRATMITLNYTMAFFRQHLLGTASPLLTDLSPGDSDVTLTITKAGEDLLESSVR